MGFLKSKSASLTSNDSARLNWLKLNKNKAIAGEPKQMGPSVHIVTSHLRAHWALFLTWSQEWKVRESLVCTGDSVEVWNHSSPFLWFKCIATQFFNMTQKLACLEYELWNLTAKYKTPLTYNWMLVLCPRLNIKRCPIIFLNKT